MSVAGSRWSIDVLKADPSIRPRARVALLIIAAHANRGGVSWPDLDTIGKVAGYSMKTARRAVQELAAAGLLEVIPRPGTSNEYRLPNPEILSTPLPELWEGSTVGTPPKPDGYPSHSSVPDPSHNAGRGRDRRDVVEGDDAAPIINPKIGRALAAELAAQHRRAL